MNPEDLKYHKGHTWVRVKNKSAVIGITGYAQESLGDIVYIELPELESAAEANTDIAEIESTKATASVISPVSGTVTEINEALTETPEIINEDCYGKGWIAVVKMEDVSELEDLLDVSDYEKYVEEEAKLK